VIEQGQFRCEGKRSLFCLGGDAAGWANWLTWAWGAEVGLKKAYMYYTTLFFFYAIPGSMALLLEP